MEKLVISVLGLKGGSGKSTTARLLATAYAEAGLSVKIADFDVWQQSSTLWAARRLDKGHKPDVPVESFNSIKKVLREPYAVIVCDVAGHLEVSALKIAEVSDVILIPTDVSVDDLSAQLSFVRQLVNAGIDRSKIMMVVNNLHENAPLAEEAREVISAQGLAHTKPELVGRPAYQNAQNQGLAVYQTQFASLNDRAINVAREIIEFVKSKNRGQGGKSEKKDSEKPKGRKKSTSDKGKSSDFLGFVSNGAEKKSADKFAANSAGDSVDMNFKVKEIERAQFKMAANVRGMSSVGLLRELFADYVERKGVVLPQTLDKD